MIMNTEIDGQHNDPSKNICFPIGHQVATPGALKKASGKNAAVLYFQELLDSVESLTDIAEEQGARTLTDLICVGNGKCIWRNLGAVYLLFRPATSKAVKAGDRWYATALRNRFLRSVAANIRNSYSLINAARILNRMLWRR
jgi:hypothetical protein